MSRVIFYTVILIFLVLPGMSKPATTKTEKLPNILLILIDDLGYPAIGCYGNKMVPTPNIDRIAEKGIRFTQGYACPQCTPTRASLLTGQYTARNKMWHVIPEYGFPQARTTEPKYLEDLPRKQFTVAEALKTAGYTTAILGKWHLSTFDNDGYYTYLYPDKAHFYGFDYVNPKQNPTEYQSVVDKGVDFLTGEAIGFMKQNRVKPWFIYLSHHTVHNPVLAPKALVNKYLDKGFPEKGLHFAEYLASIEHLDNAVGRLNAKLTELKIEKNTVVIFLSDNGGVDSQLDNTPLRYGKGSAYEGGTRVPFMIQWPGHINGNITSSTPVHVVDIYPTLLAIAGIERPEQQILDGENLLPLLSGKKKEAKRLENRSIYFYQPLYDPQWGAVPSASMVKGDYKLIWFFHDYIDLDAKGQYVPEGRVELFNLKNDLGEKQNLAKVLPEKTAEMKSELEKWILATGAEIPGVNPNYNPEKWNQRVNPKKEE
jgi:arylsulfatase A